MRLSSPARCALLGWLLALAAVAAQAQPTFYEAYARGLEHEQAGRFAEAREALLQAIALRARAGTQIKTYGLNFLARYEPYARLAHVELELGRLDDAQAHLATARAQGVAEPAALAQLEQRLLELRKAAEPAPPPPVPSEPPPQTVAAPPPLVVAAPPSPAVVAPPPSEPVPTEPRRAEPEPTVVEHPPPPPPLKAQPGATATSPTEHETEPSGRSEPTASAPVKPAPAHTPPTTPARPRFPWVAAIAAGTAVALGLALALIRRRRATAASPAPPSEPEQPPTRRLDTPSGLPDGIPGELGGYELLRLLGTGGMARTFLGRRRRDGLTVAIKIPHSHLLEDAESTSRFLREGSLGATLHHPNIVRIHEAAAVDGRPFFAMEYLEGRTLQTALAEQTRFELRRALEITRAIAEALDYAHLKGVVHRDLKPDNVMLLDDGQVKVMDYGIARVVGSPGMTATGVYLGTPLYSAPESLRPGEVDHRSDLYSLGIILYHMLAGRVPFSSHDPLQLLLLHVQQPLPPLPPELGVPAAALAILERLTAKQKTDRYDSAELLLRDLDTLLHRL